MRRTPSLVLSLAAVLTLPLAARGEEPALVPLPTGASFASGTKSLSFALPDSGSPTIGMGIFLQPDGELRLDLSFDFVFSRPVSGGSAEDFGAGLAYRAYFHRVGQVAPFVQPGFTVARLSATPAGTTATGVQTFGPASATLGFGVGFGAEYLFAQQFSVGGMLGLALNLTNLGGTGKVGAALSTATSQLFAKAYF